jgi:AcrR family transcriptional regulator
MNIVQFVQGGREGCFSGAGLAESDKRAEILRAARHLALRQGLRATTMEAIAAEARVAKPTLYKYYGDKNAVFEAIVTELLVELHGKFSEALKGDGSVSERIAAALTAKYAAVTAFMAGSPHSEELYSEHDRVAGPALQVAEGESDAAVVRELEAAGVANAAEVARVVIGGAYGIFRKAKPGEDIGPAVRMLVMRVVGKG